MLILHQSNPYWGIRKNLDGLKNLAILSNLLNKHSIFNEYSSGQSIQSNRTSPNLFGLSEQATKFEVEGAIKKRKAIDIEANAKKRLVTAALRSFEEWDCTAQTLAPPYYPMPCRSQKPNHQGPCRHVDTTHLRKGFELLVRPPCVIAAPDAGRTLAVHSADVLRITSTNLPFLP